MLTPEAFAAVRSSGLPLAIELYLERAVSALRENGQTVTEEALTHLSPLKWDHINLTGDYRRPKDTGLRRRKVRPLGVSPQVVPIRTSP